MSAAVLEPIGDAIKNLRELRGLSQVELSKASGISQSYISRLESGKQEPTLGVAEDLLEALEAELFISIRA